MVIPHTILMVSDDDVLVDHGTWSPRDAKATPLQVGLVTNVLNAVLDPLLMQLGGRWVAGGWQVPLWR